MGGRGIALSDLRAAGHAGEVLFGRYALEHGRVIRGGHAEVLAELGVNGKVFDPKRSAWGDMSLEGIVPQLHEIKDKRKSGAAFNGAMYGWEIERLEKSLRVTQCHRCLAYYTILDRAGWVTVSILTLDALRREGAMRIVLKGKAAESLHGGRMRVEPKGVGYTPVRFFHPLKSIWMWMPP